MELMTFLFESYDLNKNYMIVMVIMCTMIIL